MEDEVYKELQYIPFRFKVLEHHIKVYAGNSDCGSFLREKAPERLLAHSILTLELAAAVFNAQYVNAVPLNLMKHHLSCLSAARNMCGCSIRPEEIVKRIDIMYHLDNMHKGSSAKERFDNRQRSVKPLVDVYFV